MFALKMLPFGNQLLCNEQTTEMSQPTASSELSAERPCEWAILGHCSLTSHPNRSLWLLPAWQGAENCSAESHQLRILTDNEIHGLVTHETASLAFNPGRVPGSSRGCLEKLMLSGPYPAPNLIRYPWVGALEFFFFFSLPPLFFFFLLVKLH